jgi:flagellar hook-basal body complex protein FliE
MIEPIRPPQAALTPITAPTAGAPRAASAGETFQSVLDAAIQTVERSEQNAAAEVAAVLEGRSGELHSAVLAVQRSEMQFALFLQVRNKVVGAFQEIMRVQL